ncbi:MAG TPA: hypothetical protein VEQ63_01790 [Bryobacteraceae bacterium]|nr:hypothetical protein [Bryobacteraceae bacterium]
MTEFFAIAVVATLLFVGFTFFIRTKDLPEVPEVSATYHLDQRKAAIYENLRDLQFEYRVGKLSDEDYQRTKKELQGELAGVMAEIDQLKGVQQPGASAAAAGVPAKLESASNVCPHCKATFDKPLRFCGECGKPMAVQS